MGEGGDFVVRVEDEDCSADVVCVGMAVDKMRDGEVSDIADCEEQFATDRWGTVDDDDTFSGDEEQGLVTSVRHHVGAFAEGFDIVARSRDLRACLGWCNRQILRDCFLRSALTDNMAVGGAQEAQGREEAGDLHGLCYGGRFLECK